MGDWLPSRPSWWGTLTDFAEDPDGYILGIIYSAIVSGLAVALNILGTAVWVPMDSALDAVASAGAGVDSAIQNAAHSIRVAEQSVTGSFVDLGFNAGLAAPFAQAAIAFGGFAIVAVIVWVVVQVIKVVNPQ